MIPVPAIGSVDVFDQFLRDRYNPVLNARTTLANVFASYLDWCKETQNYSYSKKRLAKELRNRGFGVVKTGASNTTVVLDFMLKQVGS